ncbi:toll/interleukin-1 receptor domain-containing protein [Erysipelotrichaceae bacterium HCN-30851]
MYRCFNLSLDQWEFENNDKQFLDNCKRCGIELKENLVNAFDSILNASIDGNGVISGENFIDSWFPIDNYDVFLSYSHDDEELALLLAGFLKYQFGLRVFIDELFWGSADDLLHKLDDKYCKNKEGNYDYRKRNFTTTHVHAMLSTAIAKTINNSEVIIFLNSEKSVYKVRDEVSEDRTLSPWIYEEVFFTTVIGEREWYEHRLDKLKESTINFQKSMKISYLVPNEHFIPIQYNDLCEWNKLWEERKDNGNGPYGNICLKPNEKIRHPLNVLYDFKCGYDIKCS